MELRPLDGPLLLRGIEVSIPATLSLSREIRFRFARFEISPCRIYNDACMRKF
jgi:hypothetical protein